MTTRFEHGTDSFGAAAPPDAQAGQVPRVCLGMPLYNQTRHLAGALESLLSQTYREFRLVIADDSTTSEPGEIVKSFGARDSRVSYFRNPTRKGMAANWRAAFQEAGPNVDFFAWVGDHDIWHPGWLEALLGALRADPEAVVAYPVTVLVTEEGEPLPTEFPHFDTNRMSAADRSRELFRRAKGFGNMVYGLFRAPALRKAGVFRNVLVPDVMLLAELSLLGTFRHVNQPLWYRRYSKIPRRISVQKRSLFPRPPWYVHLSWPLINSVILAWNTALRPGAGRPGRRFLGLKLAYHHFRRYAPLIGESTRFGSVEKIWDRFQGRIHRGLAWLRRKRLPRKPSPGVCTRKRARERPSSSPDRRVA